MTDPLRKHNVVVHGTDGAPCLVFVHGFGTDRRAWDAVAERFPEYRRVLLDLAGGARTDPADFAPHRYLDLHAHAADVLAVARVLELRDAVFVGHSVGATLCVLASLAAPELCARLVLLAASPRYRDDAGWRGGFTEADLRDTYRAITANYPE